MAKKERKGMPTGKVWQFTSRNDKHRTLQGLINGVLDGECANMDLNDENDRAYVCQAIIAALLGDP